VRSIASNTCDKPASLPVARFVAAPPAIATDGTVYVPAQEAVVAARFDGIAWATAAVARPGSIHAAPPALLSPSSAGQAALFGTTEGKVDDLLFPAPATTNGLPGSPSVQFSVLAASAAAYQVVGVSVAADGSITVATADQRIVALDPAGNVRWTAALPGKPLSAPTHGADGTLYAVDDFGTMTALAVADGSTRWTFSAPAPLRTPPVLTCDGSLFLGSDDGTVYALATDSPGLADSPWPRAGHDNRGSNDQRTKLRSADGGCVD
jgi:outer membrane protein assembly factor BamB